MERKCSITHESCTAAAAGFWDEGASCPIQRYKSSSGYSKLGSLGADKKGIRIIDDTCRYYGISRAARLEKETFLEG